MRKMLVALLIMLCLSSSVIAAGVFIPKFKYDYRFDAPGLHTIQTEKDDTYLQKFDLETRTAMGKSSFVVYYLRTEPTQDFALPVRRIFQYFSIENTDFSYYDIARATIHFDIDKEVLQQRSVGASQVVLFYYNMQEKEWRRLQTTVTSQSGSAISYMAVAPFIGNFAVGVLDEDEKSTAGSLILPAKIDGMQNTEPSTPIITIEETTTETELTEPQEEAVPITSNKIVEDAVPSSPTPAEVETVEPTEEQVLAPNDTTQTVSWLSSDILIFGGASLLFIICIIGMAWYGIKLTKKSKKSKKATKQEIKKSHQVAFKKAKTSAAQDIIEKTLSQHTSGQDETDTANKRINNITKEPMMAKFDKGKDLGRYGATLQQLQANMDKLQSANALAASLKSGAKEQMQALTTADREKIEASLNQIEPKIVRSYIQTQQSKGKDTTAIISELMSAGFDQQTVSRYLR